MLLRHKYDTAEILWLWPAIPPPGPAFNSGLGNERIFL
jgi:hypothetical protein